MTKLSSFFGQVITIFCVFFLMNSTAVAHDKVVVVPINSSSSKIKNNTSICDSSIAGSLRWTGTNFEGCDGVHWGRLSLTANVATVFSNTGRTWMDRNLGASRVATSSTDAAAYGDLYQWGRYGDGHEKRNSSPTELEDLSSTDVPGHGNFIRTNISPYDWRSGQNDNLWQGEFGINNPCPSGFRLPTATELDAERVLWASNDSAGAFGSPLKLVSAGYRYLDDGTVFYAGSYGYYWSSTVLGLFSRYLVFFSSNANVYSFYRALGFSVRCLKD